ncbi:MAG: family 10 glycosylhydrolase [Planctomycetes bacterium]|nr:family 10 glycosylhydrolase [Planctomycetota bacterium]
MRARTMKAVLRAAALLVLAANLCACQSSGPRVTGPLRAVWVTRFDYRNETDIEAVMRNCREAGFNTVLFQVRGNGTSFYDSEIEPRAEELGGADPGFDPLEEACDQAHALGMDLHAWVNVMPSWRGARPPADPAQLYNSRPEWHWYDQHGQRQPLAEGFYVSLNPCLPEVRSYLVEVCREIVEEYEVDGLHLDYIRFVDELSPPGADYPRDAATLALFAAEAGQEPERNRPAWDAWRAAKVTALVRAIRDMIEETRPEVVLSAAVGSTPEGPAARHHRDSAAWARHGLVDALYPMNYTADPTEFRARLDAWTAAACGVPVVPGVMARLDDRTPAAVRAEILDALARSPHVCVFAYSHLFGGGQDAERSARQEELLARLRALFLGAAATGA